MAKDSESNFLFVRYCFYKKAVYLCNNYFTAFYYELGHIKPCAICPYGSIAFARVCGQVDGKRN